MNRAQLISMLTRGRQARMSDQAPSQSRQIDPTLLAILQRKAQAPTEQQQEIQYRQQALDALPVPEQPLSQEQQDDLAMRRAALDALPVPEQPLSQEQQDELAMRRAALGPIPEPPDRPLSQEQQIAAARVNVDQMATDPRVDMGSAIMAADAFAAKPEGGGVVPITKQPADEMRSYRVFVQDLQDQGKITPEDAAQRLREAEADYDRQYGMSWEEASQQS